MTKTGVEQARKQLPSLVDKASKGGTTLITRHGKVCAAVVPPDQVAEAAPNPGLLALRGTGKGLWGPSPKQAIARLRNEWQRTR
jgi:antitoxin (DNA-binding transcriptional repressor) of toxin-antitoxin stability system